MKKVEKRCVARGGKKIFRRGGGKISFLDRNIDPCGLMNVKRIK
jgi:hypothetical protein